MKREFLLEFRVGDAPLPKEVIDAIMAENGRDIQKVKANFADYEDLKAELSKRQQDQSFEEAAKAWEEKYNQAVEEHRQQMSEVVFGHNLEKAILSAKGRNAKAITALLDVETIKASEDPQGALEEAIKLLQQDCGYLFQKDVPPPYARGTGAMSPEEIRSPATLAGALLEKFERK